MRSKSQQMDISLLRTMNKYLLVKVKLIITIILIQSIEILDIARVAIRKSKSKFDLLFLIFKQIVKSAFQFPRFS